MKQSQVDKLYAGLKDLARERRAKLDEALQLFTLNREINDLEQWINEKEVVASSQDLGQDYDHVTVRYLNLARFIQFACFFCFVFFFKRSYFLYSYCGSASFSSLVIRKLQAPNVCAALTPWLIS